MFSLPMSFWWLRSDRGAICPVTVFWGLSGWRFYLQQIWGPIWLKVYRTLLYSPPVLSLCILGACCFGLGLVRGRSLSWWSGFWDPSWTRILLFDVIFRCVLNLVSIPTMWIVWIYFASLPSVLSFVKSTIDKLSRRIITLSSSVSAACSISPSSRIFPVLLAPLRSLSVGNRLQFCSLSG